MKLFYIFIITAFLVGLAIGQNEMAKQIFDTEKAFERTVEEKGINAGFIEYMAPLGVMFVPEASNAREFWRKLPPRPTYLKWNPIWIDVASNGALAYSIGNSIRKPGGADDTAVYHGHYLSVWGRQPDGSYRALLDTGISHEKPESIPVEWRSPADIGKDSNEARVSAADSAVHFYQAIESKGVLPAYKTFLADDAVLIREGKQPFLGKTAALKYLSDEKPHVRFSRRKTFVEAADLAFVYNPYEIRDEKDVAVERGNFVHIWKLRKGKWYIVADAWIPTPAPAKK